MAKLIQAVTEFRPKLERVAPVKINELGDYIARITGQQRSQTTAALIELEEAILFFHAVGRSVQLSGLGSFGAGVGLDGKRRILFRPGRALVKRLNASEFRGYMNNAANAGSSQEDLKALWDAAHPDDPLDLTGSIGVSGSGRSAGTSGTESGTGTSGAGTGGAGSAGTGPVAPPQD